MDILVLGAKDGGTRILVACSNKTVSARLVISGDLGHNERISSWHRQSIRLSPIASSIFSSKGFVLGADRGNPPWRKMSSRGNPTRESTPWSSTRLPTNPPTG